MIITRLAAEELIVPEGRFRAGRQGLVNVQVWANLTAAETTAERFTKHVRLVLI